MCGINGAFFLGFHLLLFGYWVSYQSEFLDSKLLDKTLDISDKSFHVVSINPLWLPRLVVSSEGQNFKLTILRAFLQLEGDSLTYAHLISTATTRCVFWKCRIWFLQANLVKK